MLDPISASEFYTRFQDAWENRDANYAWGFTNPIMYISNAMNWYSESADINTYPEPQYLVRALELFNEVAHLGARDMGVYPE